MLYFSFQKAKVVNTVNYQMFYLSLHYQFLVEFNNNHMLYLGEPFTVHSSNCILIMPVKDLTSTSNCSKPNVVTAPTTFHNQRTFRSFYRVNLFIFVYNSHKVPIKTHIGYSFLLSFSRRFCRIMSLYYFQHVVAHANMFYYISC